MLQCSLCELKEREREGEENEPHPVRVSENGQTLLYEKSGTLKINQNSVWKTCGVKETLELPFFRLCYLKRQTQQMLGENNKVNEHR